MLAYPAVLEQKSILETNYEKIKKPLKCLI